MLPLNTVHQLIADNPPAGKEVVVLPLSLRMGADLLTPVSAFYALRQGAVKPFLLESVEGGEKLARYSFLGRNPFLTISGRGDTTLVERTGAEPEIRHESVPSVLSEIGSRYREIEMDGLPRLTAGAVGFMAYDVVRTLEYLPSSPPDDLDIPDGIWSFYDTLAAFDHVSHQLVLMSSLLVSEGTDVEAAYAQAHERLLELKEAFSRPVSPQSEQITLTSEMSSNMTREQFERMVERARDHIVEGDVFQIVLSQRFSTSFEGDPFRLYRALRQVNPSPYLFHLEFDAFTLVGSSPEVLVRVENGRAELLPIAGTRRRGASSAEDDALANDLLADPKERAEHLMLVDLGRNDLGRISRYGSVEVDRYAYIERYSHVMHIVSSVSGALRDNLTPVDVLSACFPAGTVSGAPKVRAMQLIDDMEPTRRGVYAGAVGYMDFRGNMDTCIAIRTMVVQNGRIHIQAGAGIVYDSVPRAEYEETRNKAEALHRAIGLAANELQ
ncbi:MAG: anthranilate synthase component I [Bacteroidetes bacterium CG12_big_fil_rev_8_21_14_0_65_60_17]|nr:MAG: anthranilate synthase component I [Bacteroidetes bacterium CG12_big_fil_rev_8_21_14_0_65_60_17]